MHSLQHSHLMLVGHQAAKRSVVVGVAWAKTAWRAYEARQRRRATAAVLSQLSDRTLHDIGVDRSEIDSIAGNPRDASRRWVQKARPAQN